MNSFPQHPLSNHFPSQQQLQRNESKNNNKTQEHQF